MQQLNVLFLGFGSIANKHAHALRRLFPAIQLDALRSSVNNSEIEGVRSFYSYDDLDLQSYNFVIVSNPSFLHAESIIKIAKQTKAFFIEKPAFLNIDEGQHVIESIGDKINYVACNLRFLDCLQEVKRCLDEGLIRPIQADFKAWSYLPDWRPSQDYRLSYSASISKGGGVLYDLIHEPDYIYWLFGKPISSSVTSYKLSSLEIDSPDTAQIKFDYPSLSVTGSLSYASRVSKRTLNILAEDGLLEIDLIQNTILKNGIVVFQSSQRITDTYLAQMSHFLDCLINGKNPINDVNQAMLITELLHF